MSPDGFLFPAMRSDSKLARRSKDSGFRKRGRRNGVASVFFRCFLDFFHFLPFFTFPFLSFFVFLVGLRFIQFFFRFLPFFFFCFLPFHFHEETGRHHSRDPFSETPKDTVCKALGRLRQTYQVPPGQMIQSQDMFEWIRKLHAALFCF